MSAWGHFDRPITYLGGRRLSRALCHTSSSGLLRVSKVAIYTVNLPLSRQFHTHKGMQMSSAAVSDCRELFGGVLPTTSVLCYDAWRFTAIDQPYQATLHWPMERITCKSLARCLKKGMCCIFGKLPMAVGADLSYWLFWRLEDAAIEPRHTCRFFLRKERG